MYRLYILQRELEVNCVCETVYRYGAPFSSTDVISHKYQQVDLKTAY